MKKAFTLVETLISVSVVAILSAGIYIFLNAVSSTYNVEYGTITLQQAMRKSVDLMSRDIRGASRGNMTVTSSGITFNTTSANGIQYYRDGATNELIRHNATQTKIVAGCISGLSFSLNGNLLSIQLSGRNQIGAFKGARNITLNLTEEVRLRND